MKKTQRKTFKDRCNGAVLGIVLTLAGGLLAGCGGKTKDGGTAQVKYVTKVLKYESRVHNMMIPANIHGMNEVEIYPQVEGIIRKVNFLDGTKVSKGQMLFVIDQTEHKLRVRDAQADLSAAKAQMETTRLRYESNKRLAAKKIISDYVLETSLNAYHVAQAAVEEAESQLAIARTNLSYCTVTSPITGIVKENGFKVGALANVTDKLCTVSDDSEVVDERGDYLFVLEGLLEHIQRGLPLGIDLGDGLQDDLRALTVEIVHKDAGVVLLLAELDEEPVCYAFEALVLCIEGHREIEISRPELCVDLLIDCIVKFLADHNE